MTAIDITEYQSSPPPPFGHSLLPYFPFDPNYVNLNHGSYGSLPLPVRDFCNDLGDKIESSPDLWMRFKYQPLLIKAREDVANLIGVKDADEVVLLPNASQGLNLVLRSFIWEKEDIIVICNTTYNSISRTAYFLSDLPPHPSVSEFSIVFPTTHAAILESWRGHLASLRKDAGPNAKIVAVIDGIISLPGCLLPWEEMTKTCRSENIWSVIDAAHNIGQQVDINLDECKPDFWVSNCHKWLFAKRGAAVLYVPKRNQHIVRASFPTSFAYISPKDRKEGDYNFVEQFEWNGTIDFVPLLSIEAAFAFRSWLGGEHVINAYTHKLAVEGGKRLAQILGTKVLDEDGEFTESMANVQLPIPLDYSYPKIDELLKRKLLLERKMFAAPLYHNRLWWVRCSAQVWLEVSDFETLGRALLEVCPEIIEEVATEKA